MNIISQWMIFGRKQEHGGKVEDHGGLPLRIRVLSLLMRHGMQLMQRRDGSVERHGTIAFLSTFPVPASLVTSRGTISRDTFADAEHALPVRLFLPQSALGSNEPPEAGPRALLSRRRLLLLLKQGGCV